MADDYDDLRDWMRRPDVRAAVDRQAAQAEEEEEPQSKTEAGNGTRIL